MQEKRLPKTDLVSDKERQDGRTKLRLSPFFVVLCRDKVSGEIVYNSFDGPCRKPAASEKSALN